MMPIVISIPPYHFWEPPPDDSPLPRTARTSACSSHAEVLGMGQRVIFVKDEDGLYDKDPKRSTPTRAHPARSRCRAQANMPEELILDAAAVRRLATARHVTRVQIVNGLKPGMLTARHRAARTSAP
jgi:molybdenum storage protein